MADKFIKIEIATPQKFRQYEEAVSCTAPGVMGSFQVLYDHAPLVAQLEIGELKIETPEGTLHFAAGGGVIQVLKNKVLLLLDSCEAPEEIDVQRAKDALERAKRRLQEKDQNLDFRRAEFALTRALNRLHVAERISQRA